MSEPVPCNYCKVDDATVVFPAGVAQLNQIVRCNRCGLMYASPRAKEPDHLEIAAYDPAYNPLHPRDTRVLKEQLQVRDYERTRALLNRLYPQRGKLRGGWQQPGLPAGRLSQVTAGMSWASSRSTRPAAISREELGLEVINGILETANLPDEFADVVLLNHVIEHLDDPLQTLREVNRILKPGGHFVIETPRYDTLMFKLLGRRERSVSCPGPHLLLHDVLPEERSTRPRASRPCRLDYVGRSLTGERLLLQSGGDEQEPQDQNQPRTSRAAIEVAEAATLFESQGHAAGLRSEGRDCRSRGPDDDGCETDSQCISSGRVTSGRPRLRRL